MRKANLINPLFAIVFAILLSTSVFAQEKPSTEEAKKCCADKTAKHVCTEECKTSGCDAVKANEAKACKDTKHVCTAECKTSGCDAVKANEAKACEDKKHVCTDECHDKGCDEVKANEAKAALDLNKDGYVYECSMKCETSDNAGDCSKCGMELKKVSVTDS